MLDVFLGSANDPKADDGVDCTLVVSNATDQDRESFFKLEKVDVSIDGFDVRVRESQNPVRAWFAATTVRTFLEAKIKEAVSLQRGLFTASLGHRVDLLFCGRALSARGAVR